jgi:deoxyribodipyrimidine photolyase-like uncharacterized protein
MTSEFATMYTDAYVWVWLPNAIGPVVAGVLAKQGQQLVLTMAAAIWHEKMRLLCIRQNSLCSQVLSH